MPRGPLLAALSLRLALPVIVVHVFGGNDEAAWARFLAPDTYSYLIPAQNLLEHGAFFANATTPEIFRTPGYPLLLAIGLIVRNPIIVTLLLQALAGTLTVWCTMRIALLLLRQDGGSGGMRPGQPGGTLRGGTQPGGTQPDGVQLGGMQPGGMQPGGVQPGGVQPVGVQSGGVRSGLVELRGSNDPAVNVRAVTMCGWLAACEPLSIVYGAMLIADTLLATAISVVVLLLVTHLRRPSTRSAIAVGLALAAAAYIKPIAYYLPAVVIPWLWFEQRRRAARGQAAKNEELKPLSPTSGRKQGEERGAAHLRHCLALAATFAILCGAWQVRNGMVAGFWGFSTLTARAVYVTAGGGVTAARDGRPFGEVRQERLADTAISTSREPLHVGDMYRRGLGDVLGSPITALAVHARGMLLTLFDPGSLDLLRLFGAYPRTSPVTRYDSQGLAATVATIARDHPAVVWCSLVLEAILLGYLALAARGAWRALPADFPEARALLLLAAYFLMLSGGIFGAARFRLPIMPMMILLGGYALPRPKHCGYTERA